MPFYNKLYNAFNNDEFNLFYNNFLTEKIEGNIKNQTTSTGNSSSSSSSEDKNSNTPQSGLLIEDIRAGKYMSNYSNSEIEDKTENSTSSSGNSTENTERTYSGYNGTETLAELFLRMQNEFTDIDMMIINQLNPLFMGLWS